VEARGISDTAQREAEQLLATANAGKAAQPEAAAPVAEPEAPAAEPEPEPAPSPEPASSSGFTPPPSSLEDLAAASRPTKFSVGRR